MTKDSSLRRETCCGLLGSLPRCRRRRRVRRRAGGVIFKVRRLLTAKEVDETNKQAVGAWERGE